MYGAQTCRYDSRSYAWFENDVEMYGAQTFTQRLKESAVFENDVEMYGAQTYQFLFTLLQ